MIADARIPEVSRSVDDAGRGMLTCCLQQGASDMQPGEPLYDMHPPDAASTDAWAVLKLFGAVGLIIGSLALLVVVLLA
jgi:hypothetical protein